MIFLSCRPSGSLPPAEEADLLGADGAVDVNPHERGLLRGSTLESRHFGALWTRSCEVLAGPLPVGNVTAALATRWTCLSRRSAPNRRHSLMPCGNSSQACNGCSPVRISTPLPWLVYAPLTAEPRYCTVWSRPPYRLGVTIHSPSQVRVGRLHSAPRCRAVRMSRVLGPAGPSGSGSASNTGDMH